MVIMCFKYLKSFDNCVTTFNINIKLEFLNHIKSKVGTHFENSITDCNTVPKMYGSRTNIYKYKYLR